MITDSKVTIKGHPRNIKFYTDKGYKIRVGEAVLVSPKDLMSGASVKVNCSCDSCGATSKKPFKEYFTCTDGLENSYYCNKCKGAKIKQTNQKRYGVDNVMQLDTSKVAMKMTNVEKYGTEHYYQSDDFKGKYKASMNEKYGVDNAFQSEVIKDKIKQANLKKYNVEYPQQNPDILEKSYQTNLKKYGVKRPLESPAIRERMSVSNRRKWGYANTFQLESARLSLVKTNNERYRADYPLQNEAVRAKAQTSILLKYGTTHPMKNKEFLHGKEQDNLLRYGVKHPFHKQSVKNKLRCLTNDRTLNRYNGISIPDTQLLTYSDNMFRCMHVSKNHEFTLPRAILHDRLRDKTSVICTTCHPIDSRMSSHELYIKEFLDSLNIKYLKNNRTVLGNRHLDFYIPSHNLAIEFNGLYWHSEIHRNEKYHIDKTIRCLEKGIDLLHIFEDDWIYRQEIVKSMILNKLKLIPEKIYARKCVIKTVSPSAAVAFLDGNHIQGACKSTYKFGLYHNGELVSLMTFGYRKTNAKREFELVRFCNKLNLNVIGASSKLFKHAIQHMEFAQMVSYSDLAMFNGAMYEMLGFRRIHLSKPNYFWVVNGNREHRWKYNKQSLIKDGYDASKTEVEIMHERGYYRIWGCGQVRWVYTIKGS
jgi:hypothetical protein